jgi:glycosyltransferase involved in cell wall biosynthesis
MELSTIKVSVIIPVRNELKYVNRIIKSILEQDYPIENIEYIIVDGLSNDGTRQILEKYAQEYSFIYLLDNHQKIVPHALNIGIKEAKGDIIIRLDAHAEYPPSYISTLVYYLDKLGADNVGGVWETFPSSNTKEAKSIATALSTPFGVGNAEYRIRYSVSREYVEVDTVPFGCYRREVFDRIGLFDEDLTRNQDNEFNERLKKAGGKIYLIPNLKIKYFARESYSKLFKMQYQYGYFGPLVDLKLKRPTRLRRYIPTLFVLSLILPLLMIPVDTRFGLVSAISLGLYILASVFFSLYELYRRKNISLFPFLAYAYLVSHISYGIGYIAGVWDFLLKKKHLHKKVEVTLSR